MEYVYVNLNLKKNLVEHIEAGAIELNSLFQMSYTVTYLVC
jgi:hypothetical protein